MKISNKILIIFIFFLILIILFSMKDIKAFTATASNNQDYTIPDFTSEMNVGYGWICFIENNATRFNVYILLDENGYFYNNGGSYHYGRVMICNYSTSNNTYSTRTQGSINTGTLIGGAVTSSSILAGNVNFYSDINKNNIFFHFTPPMAIIATAVEETEMEKVLEEVLIILPTILVIMVSYLGFRKALQMLSTVLHQS